MRIRPLTLTGPQISASIPSETDYRGLSQTHGIITGSPLGQCSLRGPQMEKPALRCAERSFVPPTTLRKQPYFHQRQRKTIFLTLPLLLLSPQFQFLASSHFSSSVECVRHGHALPPDSKALPSFQELLFSHCSSFFFLQPPPPPLLFHTLRVSTISPPCGQFTNGTQGTVDIARANVTSKNISFTEVASISGW